MQKTWPLEELPKKIHSGISISERPLFIALVNLICTVPFLLQVLSGILWEAGIGRKEGTQGVGSHHFSSFRWLRAYLVFHTFMLDFPTTERLRGFAFLPHIKVTGFEPMALCIQNRCADQTALHLVSNLYYKDSNRKKSPTPLWAQGGENHRFLERSQQPGIQDGASQKKRVHSP